jgi:hypothetical protein
MQLEIDGNNLMFVLTNFGRDGNHFTNAGNAMVKRSNIVGALFIANDFGCNIRESGAAALDLVVNCLACVVRSFVVVVSSFARVVT